MLEDLLEQSRILTDEALERLLPPATQYPTSIHQAMRHSVFAGGRNAFMPRFSVSAMMAARASAGHSKLASTS